MAYYLIKANLIIAGVDFDTAILTALSSAYERRWRVGELIHPNSSLVYDTSGISFSIFSSAEDPNWLEGCSKSLADWVEQFRSVFDLCPIPLISICIRTGGTDFPPLYFSRSFLKLIEEMKAELDIDVITTAELEKCED